MKNRAVIFKSVFKEYHKGPRRYPSLRDYVTGIFSRRKKGAPDIFLALKNLSLTVKKGEVIGFVGPNGAGKSTILKLISKVTYPSKGRVLINGNVSGILELGAGFHPELTGRENIFFKASILGMKKEEIKAKLDSIINFAGIDDFINTPIKHYSSGMHARLGFSVAVHLDPDILLIDEVLSVGDAEFREKCISRIKSFCKDNNKTVIMVSHNMDYLKRLCQKVYWLEQGKIVMSGKSTLVIKAYLNKVEKNMLLKSKKLAV